MPTINKNNGIEMADIAKINEQDVPSGGGGGTATTTPTFTFDNSTVYLSQGVTITNTSSYTNAQFKVVVTVGSTTIASVITADSNITWSDNNSATGARTVTVTADEFGDFTESAAATNTYSRTDLNFRYYRFYGSANGTTASTGWNGFYNIRLYESAGQSGTAHPENLTSNTSGEANGYYVDTTYRFNSTYEKFKAFDSNVTGSWHWTLSVSSASDNFAGFHFDSTEFPTPPTILSLTYRSYSNPTANYVLAMGSNTGDFTGEEEIFHVFDQTAQVTNTTYNVG
jgi:hypothetical protein|tara:strand:+ start:1311 stop:2162 length:852 start_codon:yes stop_codon:yes gene_type:complete